MPVQTWERVSRAFSVRRNLELLLVAPDTQLRPLDGLRAISILWVIVFHAAWYAGTYIPLPSYVALLVSPSMLPVWRGDFGVDIFFVLSGFLIAGMLIDERERTGRLALWQFYWRRLLRLWPALFIAAILYVQLVGEHAPMIWANVLYVSNFVPILQAAMGWTWSLAIEEQFYLVCPWLITGLAAIGPRHRIAALLAVLALLTAIGAWVVVSGSFSASDAEIAVNRDGVRWALGFDHLYVKPWMRAGPLLVGALAAYLFRMPRFMTALATTRGLGIAAFVAALVIAALSTHWPLAASASRVFEVGYLAAYRAVFGAGIAFVLLFSLSKHPVGVAIGRFLSWRYFYPVGQLAYSAYLVNPIVCAVVHARLARLVREDHVPTMLAFLPFDLIGTLLVAAVIYVFVERPFMSLRPGERSARGRPIAPISEATFDRRLFFSAVAIATVLAWSNRFIQDDAFISFRYARHVAAGHGFVWNVGEAPIQGFTNPLWTLVMALAIRLGRDPVRVSQWLGLGCFVITLIAAGKLAAGLTGARRASAAVVLALGLNASFNAYATGGLETQSQAMFVAIVAYGVSRGGPRGFAAASIAAGLALWTRLDSALLVAPLLLVALIEARRSAWLVGAVVVPVTLLGAGLAAFGWVIFHQLLPNTFYAKTGSVDMALVQGGLRYLIGFLTHYQLVPILALAVYFGRGALRRIPLLLRAVAAVLALWAVYVVSVGGDFMEYRLFVPAIPLGVVLAAWLFYASGERFVWVLTAASVVCSALFFVRVRQTPALDEGLLVETVQGLDAHLTDHNQDWAEVGRGMKQAFACDPDVTIGVMAAGAIPYYSDLRTVDMLGLNDPWVARYGNNFGSRPGHRRVASVSYLVRQHVNIVLHPWARFDPEQFTSDYTRAHVMARYVPLSSPDELPPDASMIEIPIAKDRKLRALYLVHDAKVDACIAAGNWRVLPIRASGAPDPMCSAPGCIRRATKTAEYTRELVASFTDPAVTIDNGYSTWSIEYMTGDRTSLATVALPLGVTPPARGYSIVANNHGTTGLDDPCAITGTPFGAGLAGLFGARGMIGVASDYPGIGTAGVHPYLVSEVEGRASLDALRAARALARWQGVPTSDRYAVVGASQGGHATLAAAAMQATVAPELDIRAFAAAAPSSLFEEQWRSDLATDGPQVEWIAMLVYAWTDHYGYRGPSPWAAGIEPTVRAAMSSSCAFPLNGAGAIASSLGLERAKIFAPDFLRAYQSGEWGAYASFSEWFTKNRVKPYAQKAPLKIYQGDADPFVHEPATSAVVESLRAGGVVVDYEVVPGGSHTDVAFGVVTSAEKRTAESIAWLRARLEAP